MKESITEPDLPIVDAHHHLWDFVPRLGEIPVTDDPYNAIIHTTPRYLFDELLADARCGHNIVATVFVQSGSFYRADGDVRLKAIGEVEFANGVAARSASGVYGAFRACAGIVGHVDLTLGDAAMAVLDAQMAAGNGRLRGIRQIGAHDSDPAVLGPRGQAPAGLFSDAAFRRGFACLQRAGMTFDAWLLEPQLPEVVALARAFPDQQIILDHVGTPSNRGIYHGRLNDRYNGWRNAIQDLATCANVSVKLGGLAMPFCGLPGLGPKIRPASDALATLWRPYIEPCIEAFGPRRCMFESNYPVDRWGADYATLWNAFKRITHGASADDKHRLFAGTAVSLYRLSNLSLAHADLAERPERESR